MDLGISAARVEGLRLTMQSTNAARIPSLFSAFAFSLQVVDSA